jgi:subtilisin family serine protease
MHRATLALFVLFVSAAAFAQETLQPAGEPVVRVIVEFRDPPLAVRPLPLATYRANFDRLRRDVAVRQGKSGLPEPLVSREYFEAFHGVAMSFPREMLARIRALPYVKRVHLDTPVQALTEPNIEAVGAVRTWNTLGSRGAGVTVAIIDTGIDYRHPALRNVHGGWDFVNNDADPMDDHGHGTHVAGIVAGNLDDFTGVAPDATLVAYKVLDANGSGLSSVIIAAIERALDPNQDGDLSDHASVANLSLGGRGNPDDAASLAVDNAVAAGMVVCVSAGNNGAYHTVGSPGTARDAITVGAVDNSDRIATFSSKGPSAKIVSIKPDVVAPGVSIRSSYLNGGYATLSGTSMAAPHVAGAAALLRAIHPDWSPADVKAALMLYAKPLPEEQMAQGAGRIDIARSAEGTISAWPASISFGLDALTTDSFQKAQRIRVTNRGTKSESISVSIDGVRRGVTFVIVPQKLDLAPGASDDVTVSISVANEDTAPPTSDSYSFSGFVTLDTATAQTHLPWAVVKASRATLITDLIPLGQFWLSSVRLPSPVAIDESTIETVLPAGEYDMLLIGWVKPDDGTPPIETAIIAFDQRSIRGDVKITANRSLAAHALTLNAVGANGTRLATANAGYGYVHRTRIVTPAGSFPSTIDMPLFTVPKIDFSDLSSRWSVVVIEALFDHPHTAVTQVTHAPLKGIGADVELTNAPSDVRHAPVRLPAPAEVTIGSYVGTKGLLAKMNTSAVDLYMTPPDAAYPVLFSITTPELSIPSIVAHGDRIDIGSAYSASDGEPLEVGVGPLYPRQPITIRNSLLQPPFGFVGQVGDYRTRYDTAGFFTVTNSGAVVASGTPLTNAFYLPPRQYTVDYTTSIGPVRTQVTATIDATAGDANAPWMTSMYLADGNGRAVTKFAPDASGTLRFAADVTSAKVSIRDGAAWRELPVVFDGENRYHAELANMSVAAVDLRIELVDAKGNRMTYTLAPAFTVGDVPMLPRRRP